MKLQVVGDQLSEERDLEGIIQILDGTSEVEGEVKYRKNISSTVLILENWSAEPDWANIRRTQSIFTQDHKKKQNVLSYLVFLSLLKPTFAHTHADTHIHMCPVMTFSNEISTILKSLR